MAKLLPQVMGSVLELSPRRRGSPGAATSAATPSTARSSARCSSAAGRSTSSSRTWAAPGRSASPSPWTPGRAPTWSRCSPPKVTVPVHFDDYGRFALPLGDFVDEVRRRRLPGRAAHRPPRRHDLPPALTEAERAGNLRAQPPSALREAGGALGDVGAQRLAVHRRADAVGDDLPAADPDVADVPAAAGPHQVGQEVRRRRRPARRPGRGCRRARGRRGGPTASWPEVGPAERVGGGAGGQPERLGGRERGRVAPRPAGPAGRPAGRRRAGPARRWTPARRCPGRRGCRGRACRAAARSRWPAWRCWPGSARRRRRTRATAPGRRRPCARSARPAPGHRGRRARPAAPAPRGRAGPAARRPRWRSRRRAGAAAGRARGRRRRCRPADGSGTV